MRFSISKSAQRFFNNIIGREGFPASNDKNKFIQFDVYYCCALLGMAARQRDDDTSELSPFLEGYPKQYVESRAQIAGLLVASEAKIQGINIQSSQFEAIMLEYLDSGDTLLSEEGIKALNAYSLKGYHLMKEYASELPPTSREEFLETFYSAIKYYTVKED